MGDDVLDSEKTLKYYRNSLICRTFEGGNHRFAHMKESIEDIICFITISEIILEN